MVQNRNRFLVAIFCCSLSACAIQTTEDRRSTDSTIQQGRLADRIDNFTDESLNVAETEEAIAVSGFDCPIPDSEVDEINDLLLLTQGERSASLARHATFGVPVPTTPVDGEITVFQNEYVINYDTDLKIPTYAVYKLNRADVVSLTRVNCFREDPRLSEADRSTLADYVEPVFDRGHLVPRADMNRSRSTMLNTFVLSNMMPQHDNFNQGIWRTLESAVRVWATDKGEISIVTGAVFDQDGNNERDANADVDRARPREKIAIPTHFYKIVINELDSGFVEPIAVLLRHTDDEVPMSLSKDEELDIIRENLTSVDNIEQIAGYDFFPDMPANKQKAVERAIAPGLWGE